MEICMVIVATRWSARMNAEGRRQRSVTVVMCYSDVVMCYSDYLVVTVITAVHEFHANL